MRRCVFLDRDGVINLKARPGEYIRTWEEFRLIPAALDWIRLFNALDLLVIVVTNQRGVARGLVGQADLERIHENMRAELARAGARIDDILCCVHEEDTCNCRKPGTGMVLEAARKWDIDLGRSLMVGDSHTDRKLAEACGMRFVGVDEGKVTEVRESSVDNWDQHWADIGTASEMGPTPKYRTRIIFRLLKIDAQDESARILDIGSGTGEFAEELRRRYPRIRYLGLELSRTGVESASRRVPELLFLQRDLLQPEESDQFLDFGATHAVCSEVLEHLDEPRVLLGNASRYMAPGCKLIVTVPSGPMSEFYRHIGHRRHYTSGEMCELLQSAGFRIEQAYNAGFPFFNLFRLFITWRGNKLMSAISGPPSRGVRFGMRLFDVLFRFNLMRWGWQTIAVARYCPQDVKQGALSEKSL